MINWDRYFIGLAVVGILFLMVIKLGYSIF